MGFEMSIIHEVQIQDVKTIDCNQNRPELGLLEENMPKHGILWLVVDNQLQVTAYFP